LERTLIFSTLSLLPLKLSPNPTAQKTQHFDKKLKPKQRDFSRLKKDKSRHDKSDKSRNNRQTKQNMSQENNPKHLNKNMLKN